MTSAWPEAPFRRYRPKVPEVTVLFWIVKLLASIAGAPIADLLDATLGLGITTIVMTTLLVITVLIQVVVVRYVPWLYWLTVLLVSVFGLLLTDSLVDNLDVPLAAAAIAFAVLLAATFVLWQVTERTLSLHTIDTPSREAFYWLAVTFAFALGTADSRVVTPSFRSAVIAALSTGLIGIALMGATVGGRRFAGRAGPVAFWIAYVLTQPLGISLGDLFPGAGVTALAVFAALVTYLSVTHHDDPSRDHATRRVRARLR